MDNQENVIINSFYNEFSRMLENATKVEDIQFLIGQKLVETGVLNPDNQLAFRYNDDPKEQEQRLQRIQKLVNERLAQNPEKLALATQMINKWIGQVRQRITKELHHIWTKPEKRNYQEIIDVAVSRAFKQIQMDINTKGYVEYQSFREEDFQNIEFADRPWLLKLNTVHLVTTIQKLLLLKLIQTANTDTEHAFLYCEAIVQIQISRQKHGGNEINLRSLCSFEPNNYKQIEPLITEALDKVKNSSRYREQVINKLQNLNSQAGQVTHGNKTLDKTEYVYTLTIDRADQNSVGCIIKYNGTVIAQARYNKETKILQIIRDPNKTGLELWNTSNVTELTTETTHFDQVVYKHLALMAKVL